MKDISELELMPVQRHEDSKVKDYLPIDFVKQFEDRIMHSHGQTVERLKERGGLSWKELAWAMTDCKYFDPINAKTEFEAKKWVAWQFLKWLMYTYFDVDLQKGMKR